MKLRLTIFLQVVVVFITLAAFALMIIMPLKEGRAKDLDIFTVYLDAFILYGYAASIAFYAAMYKVFRLLGYVAQNKAFSTGSIKSLSSIKRNAVILGGLIVLAAVFIKLFHHASDDPAGFIVLCAAAMLLCLAWAAAAAVLEAILQKGLEIQLHNEQLQAQLNT